MTSKPTPSIRFSAPSQKDARGMLVFFILAVICSVTIVTLRDSNNVIAQLFLASVTSGVIAIIIWQACEPFAEAAQWLGNRFRISPSVRGATIDAVASSMPELFSGVFFVTVAISASAAAEERLLESTQGFGSSIAICAGSSIYNLILIPAACAIVISRTRPTRPTIEFSPEVINRDGSWVIGAQAGLLIMLFLPTLHWWMALIGLGGYLAYIIHLAMDARKYRQATSESESMSLAKETPALFGLVVIKLTMLSVIVTLAVCTMIAAVACYALVELTNHSAHAMGVPPFFVAVILAAATSSIPDTFVSIGSARRGDDSGAISNVFGSNIFDICIGMSLPLLVCCFLNDWQPLVLVDESQETIQGVAGLRVLLFVLTGIVMFTLWRRKQITYRTGIFFCLLYLVFVGYAVLGSMNVF